MFEVAKTITTEWALLLIPRVVAKISGFLTEGMAEIPRSSFV
jgi:hypothetical protein